jgi:hypothetical protein
MSIQKKSLISALKTTKKANVASIPTEGLSGEKQTSMMKVTSLKSFKAAGGSSVKSLKATSMKSFKGVKVSNQKSFKGVKVSNQKSFKSASHME